MNLEARLRERIQREGPISFYEWMKAALYDERDGYYNADRIRQGRAGDYRTAPETSPLFAATFANYFAKVFVELGSPDDFAIVEFGAGSGEFAHGVLTTLHADHPNVFKATNYLIREVGNRSRAHCEARLSEFSDHVTIRNPTVREGAGDTITGIIFSNELTDAFPVNRVVKRKGRLRQLYVDVTENGFSWVEAEPEKPVVDYAQRVGLELDEGQVFEINLDAETFIARAESLLNHGYLVTVDYGAERHELLNSLDRRQGTLRAFQRHQFGEDVLAKPGEQDLTTTVDWTQIREAGERVGLRTIRFDRLGEFLIAEGLLEILNLRAQVTTDMAEAARLTTSARELILPTGMAASFQILVQEKKR